MKFIADSMLGRLAKWLRIIGFDTVYFQEISDRELVSVALKEDRFILTRDTLLVKRRNAKDFLLVEGDHFRDQLCFVVKRLKLDTNAEILTRCIWCNSLLKDVIKNDIKLRVPDYVFETQDVFKICQTCKKIYWGGTHRDRIKQELKTIFTAHAFDG
jgi:hypothetical protein